MNVTVTSLSFANSSEPRWTNKKQKFENDTITNEYLNDILYFLTTFCYIKKYVKNFDELVKSYFDKILFSRAFQRETEIAPINIVHQPVEKQAQVSSNGPTDIKTSDKTSTDFQSSKERK